MRHYHSLNRLVFVSLHSHANVIRLTFGSGASGRVFSGTFSYEDRFILTTGNIIYREDSGGDRVPANSVRIIMDSVHILSGTRAPPFRVISSAGAGRRLELGCHCLSLHHHPLLGGLVVEDGVTGITESCFRSGNFIRVRAPVVVGSAPRNTESCLIPSEVRGNGFCTLPRSPRVCGRLLVLSNFSHCVRLTEYFHSRSLHTSHRPRFARVSVRLSFISISRVLRVGRNFFGGLFGRILGVSLRRRFREVACGRTVRDCNSSGPSVHFSVGVRSVSSLIGSYNFDMFADTVRGNNSMETVITGGTSSICAEGRVSGLARCTGNVNTGKLTCME